MQVPLLRTVCSSRDYARAFIRAWRHIYNGAYPTQAQCGVLYAQWMVETGGAACWNWNIGNVKVTSAQVAAGVDWVDLPGTWEIINGQRVVLTGGDPGRRFRAFPTLDFAMVEHLAFLRNKRYAPSWPFVEAGDADGFARALKRQGYYTASADTYAAGMVSHFKRWMASAAFDEASKVVTDEDEIPTQPEIRLDLLESEPPPAIVSERILFAVPDPPPRRIPVYDDGWKDPDDEPPKAA